MAVNTALRDWECVFMDGYTADQLHDAIGVTLVGIDEQVNVVVAALSRLPSDRQKMADELMGEMAKHLRWAREAKGGAS